MVDVVGVQHQVLTIRRFHLPLAGVQAHQVFQGGGDVFFSQGAQTIVIAAQAQLAVDLVTTNACQVITLRVKEGVIQQGLRQIAGRLLTRTLLAVNLQQSLIGISHAISFQRGHHELREAKTLADLLFSPAQGLQQDGNRLAALTVNTDANGIALVDVEFQPSTAGRNNLHGMQRTLGGLVD